MILKSALFFLVAFHSVGRIVCAFDQTHGAWTQVLKRYQTPDGRVRYKQLKGDFGEPNHPLSQYLRTVSEVKKTEFDSWRRELQMSFLINSYNAFTVKLILDNYPVKGIKSTVGFLKSPWKKEYFSLLDGTIKTLDPIEHDILRPKYKDARVHAAVNCASVSCPRLFADAFVGDRLEAQLETAFKDFLWDKTRNRYEPQNNKIYLSKIFDWFGDDFKEPYGGYLKLIEKLGPPDAKAAIAKGAKVEFLTYDWGLNESTEGIASTLPTN